MQPQIESNAEVSVFEPRPVDAFLRSLVSRNLSANTVEAYGRAIRRLGASVGRDPIEADHATLGNWIAGLRASGLSSASVALHVSAVREFLGWARSRGIREDNPLKSKEYAIKRSEVSGHRTWSGMEPEAVSKLRAFAENAVSTTEDSPQRARALRDLALVILLSRGALRASEAADARIEDFKRSTAHVYVLEVLGKGSKRRTIPFGQSDAGWLLRWRSARKDILKAGADLTRGPFLLTESGNAFTGRTGIEKRFDAIVTGAGLPKSHPHAMRHARVNQIANSGPIQIAQQFAGHSSPDVTMGYTRRSAKDLIEGLEKGGML